jgi:choline dehydrogenase-like flavoprotein
VTSGSAASSTAGGSTSVRAFAAHLAPLRQKNWFVYAKPPFSSPEAVLAYLARYTHRVAISNNRLIALDERGVTFRYKDYRRNGPARYCTMTLAPDEFIRRFLLHVLPKGLHRIRHYGLLASASCKANIARAKKLMAAPMLGGSSSINGMIWSRGHKNDWDYFADETGDPGWSHAVP